MVDVVVRVEGLRDLRRDLRKLGDKDTPKAIRQANLEAVRLLVPVAKRRAPKRTGRLARSIRAKATQRVGSIKAGSPTRVPYAGPIHFGWAARRIRPQPFLYEAVDARRGEVEAAYERELDQALDRLERGGR